MKRGAQATTRRSGGGRGEEIGVHSGPHRDALDKDGR